MLVPKMLLCIVPNQYIIPDAIPSLLSRGIYPWEVCAAGLETSSETKKKGIARKEWCNMDSRNRIYEYYRQAKRFNACENVARVIEGKFGSADDNKAVTTVLPFGIEEMKLLVTAYDGYVLLVDELERIFGVRLTEGCFEDLSAIKTLIQRISPLYKEDADWDAQEVGRILTDSRMPLDDAARRLMGR